MSPQLDILVHSKNMTVLFIQSYDLSYYSLIFSVIYTVLFFFFEQIYNVLLTNTEMITVILIVTDVGLFPPWMGR